VKKQKYVFNILVMFKARSCQVPMPDDVIKKTIEIRYVRSGSMQIGVCYGTAGEKKAEPEILAQLSDISQ
jgi:hypothetical protein